MKKIVNVYLVYGAWCKENCKSIKIANQVIDHLQVRDKLKIYKDIDWGSSILVKHDMLLIQ